MQNIQNNEHVFIAGQTGTGKSVLAEHYLAGFKTKVLKLDTKGEVYERREDGKSLWAGLVEEYDFTVVEFFKDIPEAFMNFDKVIYVPDHTEMIPEFYNAVCKWVYDAKRVTLWIDELMEVAPSPHIYPPFLKALYTRGRSRHSVVWALTQRPKDIPAIALSQSTHIFCYNLQLPQDRKQMAEATGAPEFLEKPSKEGEFNFWYFKNGWVSPVKASLKLAG